MEMHYSRLSVPFAIWILLLMAMVLVGCKSAETPAPAELVIGLYVGTVLVIVEEYIEVAVMVERTLPPFEVPPEPPLPPNHSLLIAAREGSPNGKAYDLKDRKSIARGVTLPRTGIRQPQPVYPRIV